MKKRAYEEGIERALAAMNSGVFIPADVLRGEGSGNVAAAEANAVLQREQYERDLKRWWR